MQMKSYDFKMNDGVHMSQFLIIELQVFILFKEIFN